MKCGFGNWKHGTSQSKRCNQILNLLSLLEFKGWLEKLQVFFVVLYFAQIVPFKSLYNIKPGNEDPSPAKILRSYILDLSSSLAPMTLYTLRKSLKPNVTVLAYETTLIF